MVWIVIGHRTKTERVPDGLSVERECASCGELAMFYERRAVKTFRLYMLDVFDYDEQRVMSCGACGTLYATDEHGRPSAQSASDWREAVSSAAEQAKQAMGKAGDAIAPAMEKAGDAIGPAWERASENAKDLYEEAREGLAPLAKNVSESVGDALRRFRERDGGDRDDEPVDDDRPESERETDPEKAAVLRRFEELEKKLKGE